MFVDSKVFPWPLDAPYEIDPKTGYPTPQVMLSSLEDTMLWCKGE